MLPNRIVAAAIVALFAMQIVPAPASAQLVQSADLIVEQIDVGSLRVALVNAPVNVTIRNQGAVNFVPTGGWQIFVGLGGYQNTDCIERGTQELTDPSPATGTPCYIRVLANSPNAAIPAGQARTYTIEGGWNAERRQANNSALITAVIMNLGDNNPASPQCGPEPPLDNVNNAQQPCMNNRFSRQAFVGNPGVRAEPEREPSPSAQGGDKNAPWKTDEIAANPPCPAAPALLQKGCKVKPGRSISTMYKVTNVGTVDDSYTAALMPEVQNYLTGLLEENYTFSFAPTTFSLGPGQTRDVRLTIFVPETAWANNRTNVDLENLTVRWTSTVAPVVTTADDEAPGCTGTSFYCEDPTVPSFWVDYRRAFNITANYTHDEMTVGETSEYLLNITNEGNADDTYNVSFVRTGDVYAGSINASWDPRVSAGNTIDYDHVNVTKGETRTVRIFVTPPRNKGILNTTYSFAVQARSVLDTDGTAPCKRYEALALQLADGLCTVNFQANVKQEWGIVGFGDVAARVVPGETVTYNMGIRNFGNGYDNVSLELQTTVFGWDTRLSNTTLRLTPGNTSTFSLVVTVPPNTPANTLGSFFINTTSSGPDQVPLQERSRTSIQNNITVISGPNIRLEAPANRSFVDPGATVTFDVLVTNTGNVADNFTVLPPERPSDWGVTFEPAYLELQPLQQGTVKIGLRAPTAAEVGEKATAIAKVRSTVDRTRDRDINLEASISGPDLFVDRILVNSTNPYEGDPLEVTVAIGNKGNKAHDRNMTLRVYFVQGGVERVIGEKNYPALFIGGQRNLAEVFLWDTRGIEGTGNILARIDVDDNVREIDDSVASNEETLGITIRTFDIDITPALGQSARPGEKLTYGEAPNVFIVQYNGNQPTEPVTIRFTSEHGWLASQSELSLALPRGTAIPIIAELEIPALPGTARDTLTMEVVPALRPEEVRRSSAVTTIIDEEKPIIRSITVTPATATLGDPVVIEVVVEDATGASAATAYVTFPTNETSAVPLTKVDANTFRGDRVFQVAGRYRVAAEVLDAADPANKNDTRLPLGSFTMAPGSAPTIALATGQSLTIRTGSPIKLDIRDPLGIGKASYSIKGVSYDLRGPGYQIDTSTLTAGTVEINVTAENIYGVATSQKFTFVIDNAAPGINRVAISPERPRANEDVTITIQTEAKVEAVDVLVKRDGQVVQTLNATKRGVGSFHVTFNPPEGDYRLDVTARDAAGNTKLAESAVVFSAKPGSPFDVPGPSVLLVMLAVVGLALLLRRRA